MLYCTKNIEESTVLYESNSLVIHDSLYEDTHLNS